MKAKGKKTCDARVAIVADDLVRIKLPNFDESHYDSFRLGPRFCQTRDH